MKNKPFSKVFAAVIAGGVILSSIGIANAAIAKPTATTTKAVASSVKAPNRMPERPGKGNQADRMQADLKAAVTAGIITQAESDSITAFLKTNRPVGKRDLFANLVTNKVLTQEKADALKVFLEAQEAANELKELTAEVAKFVTDETITQAQADKIIAAVIAAKETRKAAFIKAATMSEEERKAYFDSLRENEVNPLAALVTDGTITQAQADKIGPTICFGKGPGLGKGPGFGKGHGGRGPGGPGRCEVPTTTASAS